MAQQKMFHLLQEFVRICDLLDLKYYLICGSALGAVKYGGFIPWDDDIDVAMMREDYESFCEKAPTLLNKLYFLQNYHSEPAFPAIYSKLRDSGTTCIEASVAQLPINHGICIDIFPLDGYPENKYKQFKLELKKKMYVRLLSIPCIRPEKWKEMLVGIVRSFMKAEDIVRIADAYTKCISTWNVDNSKMIANHGNWQGKLDYHQKEIYGEGVFGIFEGFSVRLPSDYDRYLKQKYGEYLQELPIDKQKSHHIYLRVDPERSYKDYINALYKA